MAPWRLTWEVSPEVVLMSSRPHWFGSKVGLPKQEGSHCGRWKLGLGRLTHVVRLLKVLPTAWKSAPGLPAAPPSREVATERSQLNQELVNTCFPPIAMLPAE